MQRTPVEQASNAGPSKAPMLVDFLPSAGADFVLTPYVQDLTARALAYLDIGYPIHLSGPAGTGKSTLALHIAAQRGLPCTLLHGDDEYRASDLIGKDAGFRRTSIRDNYVSSIVKTEESLTLVWANNRLTTACQNGHTLIYDEFTRSPATANNPFLSVLEEGILNIPSSGDQKGYVAVHPNFRAIFTSNPEEYVGVHKTQDALLDRMITIELEYPDRETEVSIVVAKSGIAKPDAETIVDLIRRLRSICGDRGGPTVRAAIAIAKIVEQRACRIAVEDPTFVTTCHDVLYYNAKRQNNGIHHRDDLNQLLREICGAAPAMCASSSDIIDIPPPVVDDYNSDDNTSDDNKREGCQSDGRNCDEPESDVTADAHDARPSGTPAADAPATEMATTDANDDAQTDASVPGAQETYLIADATGQRDAVAESQEDSNEEPHVVLDRTPETEDAETPPQETDTVAHDAETPQGETDTVELTGLKLPAACDADCDADAIGLDESLRSTLDTFDQLSTVIRHLSPRTKPLPRPPRTDETNELDHLPPNLTQA